MARTSIKTANRTRAQKVKLHKVKTKERAEKVQDVRGAYLAEKDGVVLQDILAKANSFIKYHNKIAQDGVGARKINDKVETIYLTNNQRAAHLDKSSGIQEIIDYIERMITFVEPKSK